MPYSIHHIQYLTNRHMNVTVSDDGIVHVNGKLQGMIPGGMTINGNTPLAVKVQAWKLA